MSFKAADYDRLEHAIDRSRRLSIMRRGTEYVVIPLRLRLVDGREAVDARHPTTGEVMRFFVDELDRWDLVS